MRRLGALVCCRCRNVARVLYAAADWTQTPIRTISGLCKSCADTQLAKNEEHVRQTAIARVETERDTYRAQNASSSSDYRSACAEMQDDVNAALGGWAMGIRW